MTIKTKENFKNATSYKWLVESKKKFNFEIVLSNDIFNKKNFELVDNAKNNKSGDLPRRLVFVDKNFYNYYHSKISKYFSTKANAKIIVIDISEETKNLENLNLILQYMDNFGVTRRSEPVIVMGGGVLTDVVGFACSIYRRGVPHIKLATTLLCAIDACVGAKTSVNHFGRRNRIGTYFPPIKSIIDLNLLQTLPIEELSSSLGEIIKIAVIKNKYLFELIYKNRNKITNANLYKTKDGIKIIKESITSMLEELHENLEETYLKRCVDFGHTFSPVIEMRSLDQNNIVALKHGEAVCLDVILSSCIAYNRGFLDMNELNKIFLISKKSKIPINHEYILNLDYLLESFNDAIKHRDGNQNLPLPKNLGNYVFINDLKIDEIRKSIKTYEKMLKMYD